MRRRSARTRTFAIAILVVGGLIAGGTGAPPAVAAGVRAVKVAGGLDVPVAFAFMPKGRIIYTEKTTGEVRILNPKTDFDRRFFKVTNVNGEGERGTLGVAPHPRFPAVPYVYVYATRTQGGKLWNQLIRIRAKDGRAVGSTVLLRIPAGPATNHNGGRIAFGPDGKLYLVVGDGGSMPKNYANAQDMGTLKGKLLRLNPDGKAPATNPFGDRIWSFGHRNSFGFAFDPRTDRLWETENGPGCNDEINLVVKGGNFAWGPSQDCTMGSSPTNTNNSGPAPRRLPKAWFESPIGITGATFCDRCGLAAFNGDLVFGNVNNGRLQAVGLNAARTAVVGSPATVRPSPGGAVLSVEVGPGRQLYFSDFGAIYRLAPRA
jgi:glucose/arabinose dehydrogenase